ncbi:competence protein ComK [Cytobacillus gottheilii]|uniref:competence protein ComK n=1 Tax=Cytobacillus gottheilii TaxID=859144 RepID=UPI0009BB4128|nr:competence protein ComK [Cytobacillus gottheilii]
MSKTIIDEYEINPNTMIIRPIPYGSKIYSHIIELDDEMTSPFKPLDIIKEGCRFFGSSYEGRREGTKQLTGYTHKLPITIDSTNYLYFFPTSSATKNGCTWISAEHIYSHKRTEDGETEITFKNQLSLRLPVSYNTFRNQIMRTAVLKTTLMRRIEESERKTLFFVSEKRPRRSSYKKQLRKERD